jgi:hypothetical protein
MVRLVFWGSYMVLVFRLFIWLAEHPLSIGGLVLFLYMRGRALVRFRIRFVVGVFLFLTGVSGIIVAFLYVVALCPNPVFTAREGDRGYSLIFLTLFSLIFIGPFVILIRRVRNGFGVELEALAESLQ